TVAGAGDRDNASRRPITPWSTSDNATEADAIRPRTSLGRRASQRGCSGPHSAQPRSDVDGTGRRCFRRVALRRRPVTDPGETVEDRVGNEARTRRVDVQVTVTTL